MKKQVPHHKNNYIHTGPAMGASTMISDEINNVYIIDPNDKKDFILRYFHFNKKHYVAIKRITKYNKSKIIGRFIDYGELFENNHLGKSINQEEKRIDSVLIRLNKCIKEFHREYKVKVNVNVLRGLVYIYFPKIFNYGSRSLSVSKRKAAKELMKRFNEYRRIHHSVVECVKNFDKCIRNPNAEGKYFYYFMQILLKDKYYYEVNQYNGEILENKKSFIQVFKSFYKDVNSFYRLTINQENRLLLKIKSSLKKGERKEESKKAQLEFFEKIQEVSEASDYAIHKFIAELLLCLSLKSNKNKDLELITMRKRVKSQLHEDARKASMK